MNNTKENHQPPGWAQRLLRWYCAPHLLEEVQGDLEEEFLYQVRTSGLRKAKLDYVRSVIGFLKPNFIKRKANSHSVSNMNMFGHYITVAIRNMLRYKAFSAINVLGLALGMICCLFIFLWVEDELSVDNFHKNGDDLYISYSTIISNGQTNGNYMTPIRYTEKEAIFLLEDAPRFVPEVESVTYYTTGYELPWGHPETFRFGDKIHKIEGSRASSNFFKVFSYPVIAGDRNTALNDISSIVISRKMASLFFASPQEALGKTLRYENQLDAVVTAVFEDLTDKSSLKFDFLFPWERHKNGLPWASHNMNAFIQLKKGADPERVTASLNRYLQPRLDKMAGYEFKVGLQRYRDRYLESNFVQGRPHGGKIEYVKIFSGVAVFILIIACVNFMNLATARAIKRAKEVGVRKVVGSSRFHLIGQFYGESLLLAFVALILSVMVVLLFLPAFNSMTGKQIAISFTQPSFWMFLVALAVATGIVAGSYPALFLSALKPVRILKGVVRFTKTSMFFRKGLAVLQFGLSILLLIATIVVSQQTSFVQHTHLGYDRENLLYIRVEGELAKQQVYNTFKAEALKMSGIAMVDRSSEAPHAMGFVVDEDDGQQETNAVDQDAIKWEGKEKRAGLGFKPSSVGFDFLALMNLKVVEGRGFSRDNATDSADAFMVNEEAVRQMHMKDPIGKWVSAWNKKGHIIGILKDYHTHSLHEPIKPVIIDVKEYENFGVIIVKTEPGKTEAALTSLAKVYKDINPNYPFDYQFLDQEYDKLYRNEQVTAKLSNVFATLAILISCLGLLGLIMFSSEQRTKEIGIRKVLGATVANIITLLSKDFVRLVGISFLIAAPVSAYLMNEWLKGFAYKIDLAWWIFLGAGVVAMLIAMVTVSFQAFQAAVANPVKSLRTE